MRKKRLLAVLMAAIIMMASMTGLIVQADTIGREAKACSELGILLGSDKSGVTAQYLSNTPTRLQAYIIALRLKGLYNEAGKFESRKNFSDASAAGWAKNYLAYAKNYPELGWTGYSDGRFGVNDKINAQAFYKVLLETLGYKQNVDFTYARTLEFADKIGLVESAQKIAAIKSFTINDIAKGIYATLNTNIAGTDKKLVDFLASKGVFAPEKVEAAGFNSYLQFTPMIDQKHVIAWVPVNDTFKKLGYFISEDNKTNTAYEITKGSNRVRFTEGFTTAYVNNTKYILEQSIIKDEDGLYYIPVSFIVASAGELGYDAEYIKSKNILRLQKLPEIKAVQDEMVMTRGDKRYIKVEKVFSGIEREEITNRCTFAAVNNNGIVQVGSTTGEITARNVGSAEIIVSYEGKEVDRVTAHVVAVVPKYYPSAFYEQVFETTFRLDKSNYTDVFGAVWNKDTGIVVKNIEDDSMDTGSSLSILNYSSTGAGITADLTKLLENRAIKGKTISLRIYAKAVSKAPKLNAVLNIGTGGAVVKKENSVALDDRWKSIELMKVDVPQNAKTMTLVISPGLNDEIKIDAFTMTSN
ncbi:MAG TPA: stalk domain-containing protein [Bacillota bacterium]|nr:stalk domain-containing protein [Bacillota bacterium]